MGEFCPRPIPFDKLRAAASPTDKSQNGGLPPVTSEKPHDPRVFDIPCKQFDARSSNLLKRFLGLLRISEIGHQPAVAGNFFVHPDRSKNIPQCGLR